MQLADDEMAGALMHAGFSQDVAALHVEMTRAFNEGRVASLAGRTAESTTPTRFEDFAVDLARAYQVL